MLKLTETYAKMFLASVSFRFRPVFKEKKIVIPLAITSHIPLCNGANEGLSRSDVRGLALSANDVPQRLVSAEFGLAPSEATHGLGGLIEMLTLCANLEEISFFPQSESGEVPIELAISPAEFRGKLASDPASWSNLASLFFHLPDADEWRRLTTMLPRMPKLRTLYLLVDAKPEDGDEELGLEDLAIAHDNDDDDDFGRRIATLHLRVSNSQSLIFLRRILRYWRSIESLYVSIPYGELLMDDVDFYNFMEHTPSRGRLREVKILLSPLTLEKPTIISPSLKDRLRCITGLTLASVQFGPMSFESLVALCPSIQVFTVGDGAEFFSFNEQMAYKATSGLLRRINNARGPRLG